MWKKWNIEKKDIFGVKLISFGITDEFSKITISFRNFDDHRHSCHYAILCTISSSPSSDRATIFISISNFSICTVIYSMNHINILTSTNFKSERKIYFLTSNSLDCPQEESRSFGSLCYFRNNNSHINRYCFVFLRS